MTDEQDLQTSQDAAALSELAQANASLDRLVANTDDEGLIRLLATHQQVLADYREHVIFEQRLVERLRAELARRELDSHT